MTVPTYTDSLKEKAAKIKLLICDVDGVLSDGKVYYSNTGEEIKNFNIKDGLGIKHLLNHGIQIAIITGRNSLIVEKRANELGISYLYQGKSNKQSAYQELKQCLNLRSEQIAHIGDDLPDIPLMRQSGLGICVADGHYFVKQNADWITKKNGGQGAVREVSDLLLESQHKLEKIHQSYQSI